MGKNIISEKPCVSGVGREVGGEKVPSSRISYFADLSRSKNFGFRNADFGFKEFY
jgi:hypothetical protein